MAAQAGLSWRPRKWYRWRGDRARNRKNWAAASGFYERHLQDVADDQAIWVQLGHARKEAGDRMGAVAAYRQALLLDPDDADATRHLEGVIKRKVSFRPVAPALLADGDPAAAPPRHHVAMARRERVWDTPDDARSWIDYAGALTDIGDVEGANIAFRQAAGAAEGQGEGCFHLAKALRDAGRTTAADVYMRKALGFAPYFEAYRHAPTDIQAEIQGLPDPPGRRLYLDISDFLSFVREHGHATGVQRALAGLIEALLTDDAAPGAFDSVVFAFSELGRAWLLASDDLRALVDYLALELLDLAQARRIVARARERALLCAPGAGATWLVLGGFWGDADAGAQRREARANGAKVGVLVHDIFAITKPELCEEGAAERFEPAFRDGLKSWDFVATNSRFTARDVDHYMRRHGPALPIATAPLAHGASTHGPGRWPAALDDLKGQLFVLCVGTIEPRKNHVALIDAWADLCRAHPDMPTLVLAGRPGWRAGPILERLTASGLLGSRIRWIEEVSDAELDALYHACRFTIFPSLAEGWGFPVGESLARGKACITSNASALPEAGGEFASYFDPAEPDGLRAAIEALAFQPGELERCEAAIRKSFKPRTWSDAAHDLLIAVARIADQPG
jgi:glycosyltransferase involved in cell wall biosynthesis